MNDYPELSQIENALAGVVRHLAAKPTNRDKQRRIAITAALAFALIISAAAIAGATGTGPLASQLDGLFGSDAAPSASAIVPTSAKEVKHNLGVAQSQGGRVPISTGTNNPLSVYAYAKDGRVCLVVSGHGSIGHCESYLREAGGQLSVNLGVVDSQAFVWGLASNDVSSVTVTIDGHDYPVTLAHSAYFAALPDQATASHPVTVTAHVSDGTTRVQHVPGIPQPVVAAVTAHTPNSK